MARQGEAIPTQTQSAEITLSANITSVKSVPIHLTTPHLTQSALNQMDLNHVAQQFNQRLSQQAPFYAQHFVATTKPQGLSFDTWSQPAVYQQLLLNFAKAYPPLTAAKISATQQTANAKTLLCHSHSSKALHSLWGQWYFGLLVPPMLEWIVQVTTSMQMAKSIEEIDLLPQQFFIHPHDSGRVANIEFSLNRTNRPIPTPNKSEYKLQQLNQARGLLTCNNQSPLQDERLVERRIIQFIQTNLAPSVERLTGLSPTPAKLYWSHLGYLIHWYLGEMALPMQQFNQLTQRLFQTNTFADGTVNPLYNSINLAPACEPSSGCTRRVCCLRNQLANSHQCGDCPLVARTQARRAAQG
ncbi:MAG: siderophore-iron reductase FhuF [Shewanella sp.]